MKFVQDTGSDKSKWFLENIWESFEQWFSDIWGSTY